MPAKVTINLLDDTNTGNTAIGRIINWAVTYGRYIMIGTEIIVLLAFISRFSLDRKLTDLKEEVTQKQDIIQANSSFERDVRTLQDKLTKIKELIVQPSGSLDVFPMFQKLLPQGTYLVSLNLTRGKLSTQAISGSTGSFAQFITNLQHTGSMNAIEINDITRDPLLGIRYTFSAQMIANKSK